MFQILFFNKATSPRPATVYKKKLWHRYFPVNFEKFLMTIFYRTSPVAVLTGAIYRLNRQMHTQNYE